VLKRTHGGGGEFEIKEKTPRGKISRGGGGGGGGEKRSAKKGRNQRGKFQTTIAQKGLRIL